MLFIQSRISGVIISLGLPIGSYSSSLTFVLKLTFNEEEIGELRKKNINCARTAENNFEMSGVECLESD